ncbi:MAG TPA: hypothetical protein VFT87_03035 [Candidatus Saccharimonadales bacterium]|nr:hypothetical protein [Candidatus Saccharimonadales bacterium]
MLVEAGDLTVNQGDLRPVVGQAFVVRGFDGCKQCIYVLLGELQAADKLQYAHFKFFFLDAELVATFVAVIVRVVLAGLAARCAAE